MLIFSDILKVDMQSKRSFYGLETVSLLVRDANVQALTVQHISDALGLSVSFTENLMRDLKKGGLVQAQLGQRGGYRLCEPAAGLSAWEVVCCFEPFDDNALGAPASGESKSVRALTAEAANKRRSFLQSFSLKHLGLNARSPEPCASDAPDSHTKVSRAKSGAGA
jgi:Rrf2 family protein